jgi:hypothetical protein
MFIRWQKRSSTAKEGRYRERRQPRYAAVLVRSERVNGKPVQRHMAFLGSIREGSIAKPGHRVPFWRRVNAKLDGVQLKFQLTPEERGRVEALVAERVPRVTAEQVAEFERFLEVGRRVLGGFARRRQRRPRG